MDVCSSGADLKYGITNAGAAVTDGVCSVCRSGADL